MGDRGHLLVSIYTDSTGDGYGFGQYSGGSVRLFHSGAYPAAYSAISSYLGNSTFTDILVIRGNTQNVGIGTLYPTEKLQVSGNVSATFFKGNGSQITGIPASSLTGQLNNSALPTTVGFNTLYSNTSLIVGAASTLTGSLVSGSLPGGVISSSVPALVSNSSIQTAGFFIGDGSYVSNIRSTNINGSVSNAQLPGNLNPNYITVNNGLTVNGDSFLNGAWVGNLNLNRGLGYSYSSITGCDTVYANIGSFSGNVSAAYLVGDGRYITNIGGSSITSQLSNSRLPTNANFGGTLTANGAAILGSTLYVSSLLSLGSSLQFSSGTYLNNPGAGGNGMSIVWGTGNQSTFAFQSDTNVVAYNKTGAAVWAIGVINSDGRFKKNIKDLGEATSALRNVKARRFQYKDDAANTNHIGFIVEELQPIIPEVIQPITNPETGTTNNLVRYEKLSPYLVQAFQELDQRISAIEIQLKINKP